MDEEVYSSIRHLGRIGEGHTLRRPPCLQCTFDTARHINSALGLMDFRDTIDLVKKTLCFIGQSAIKRCSNCDHANEKRCHDCPREMAPLRDSL